ncbi:MAG: hypothetical protein K0S53_2855 [Bacteroidetes bacterium]|jgi:hypothetical protein|nr:hypothetical protein [Bacteroidota bacterium]
METKIYNNRLIKFAEHLLTLKNHPEEGLFENITIIAIVGNVAIPYDMKYPSWIFDQLVEIFEEWEFDEVTGEPVLADKLTSEGTFSDICDFFNFSLDETSIFDLEGYQQPGRFGGRVLNFESKTEDIAFNIMELANSRIAGYGKAS